MPASTVIALTNHKGGCGKTTTAANLGVAFAERGIPTLMVDADPQGNLTEAFGLPPHSPGLEHALDVAEAIPPHQVGPHLHLVPTSETLAAVVANRASDPDFAYAIADLALTWRQHHRVILIDTPPGVGPLSTMALIAADRVIVPARPADHDVGGAVKLADVIAEDLAQANPELQLLGVLLTQADPRWSIGGQAREALEHAGVARLATSIPFAVNVGLAPRHGAPTISLRPDGRVARAYRRLAADLAGLLELE